MPSANKLRIGGFHPVSFIDYPQHIAAVVFMQGCNWRCRYCHNKTLVYPEHFTPAMDAQEILKHLEKRRSMLDGVVISGGEPTLQPDLRPFLMSLRAMQYDLKLDTNGSRPEVLSALLENGLIDYVAMDIKTTEDCYEDLCGGAVDITKLCESIHLLKESGVDYELRTTFIPSEHSEQTLHDMLPLVEGCKRYVVQPFIAEKASDPSLNQQPETPPDHTKTLQNIFNDAVGELIIRENETANITAHIRNQKN